MTIELSLRRRAIHARCLAGLWLTAAILILVGTYISLPLLVRKTLSAIVEITGSTQGANTNSTHIVILSTLIAALSVVSFACYLLCRSAFVEIELAARFSGLADALCIVGSDFEQLEKAVAIFVPKAKYLSVPEMFSVRDLK